MFGPLEIALAVAALLIGATGTFSPCGLSAIDTIGPTGHTGGRRTTPPPASPSSRGDRRRPDHLRLARRCWETCSMARAGAPPTCGGRDRPARSRARGPGDADRAPDPTSAAGALAAGDADAAGRRPLRRAARYRLHDLRPLIRSLGPRRSQPRGRRPLARPAARCLLRAGPGYPDPRARAARRSARPASAPPS